MTEFSENLKRARELSGYTRQDMAARLNMTVQAYGNYENGGREPNIDRLRDIASLLGVSVDYLIGSTPRDVPPVERVTRYLESIGYEVEQDAGGGVAVHFHDPKYHGANDKKCPFGSVTEFCEVIGATLDRAKKGEEERRQESIYNVLVAMTMLNT